MVKLPEAFALSNIMDAFTKAAEDIPVTIQRTAGQLSEGARGQGP